MLTRAELYERIQQLPPVARSQATTAALMKYGGFQRAKEVPIGSLREFAQRVNPRYRWYKWCSVLADALERVASGELKRVMIFAPPRHGKSELVSRTFAPYYLAKHPDHFVGISSYAANLAYTFSRASRDAYVRGSGRKLSLSASGVEHWETGLGGGMWAAGVGGPITGKGGHLLIVDDPIKNNEEAKSEVIREKQKDWFRSTLSTRAEPDAAIVVIQTRWHEDDLSGWLLSEEAGEEPEGWHIVNLPAICEEEPEEPRFPKACTVEPEWRQPGEALCPERYPVDRLRKLEKRLGSYYWSALFQQRPRPQEGDFFKWDWFKVVTALPALGEFERWVRYWDTAGTEGSGDFTVGVKMGKTRDGRFFITDRVKGQWSPGRRDQQILATAKADGRSVVQWLEREAGVGGKERSDSTVRLLAGFSVHTEPVTGSKENRAEPLASQAEVGNVYVLESPWRRDFMNTLCDFPHGKHDDDVDAASGALNKLAVGGGVAVVGTLSV